MPKITIYFLMLFSLTLSMMHFFSKSNLAAEKLKFKKEEKVKVILNPKTPRPKNGLKKRIVFKEEISIGVEEGEENYMFGNTVSFNTDEHGNFYVRDWDRKRIQKFDPEGEYLLTIGKKGQGPGEFQNLSVPRFDKNGHIYITDIVSRRISFFDREGRYLRQISIPDVFEDLYINSKGYFVSIHSKSLDEKVGLGWSIIYGLFDDRFNLISEFYSEINNPKPPAKKDLSSMAKSIANILSSIAFQPQARHVLSDNDFIYFGYPEKYAIDIFSPEGRKIKTIRRQFEPIKFGKKDKEYFVTSLAESFTQGYPEVLKKEVISFIKYPQYKPAYHSFALMENGWLAVVVEFIENEYILFDIFDQEGIYIANFKANISHDGLFFKNGKAYAVVTEDGYKFVKRYSFEIQEY